MRLFNYTKSTVKKNCRLLIVKKLCMLLIESESQYLDMRKLKLLNSLGKTSIELRLLALLNVIQEKRI